MTPIACTHCGSVDDLLDGEPIECQSCYDFFAEMRWYDYEDHAERVVEYLETRREKIGGLA